MGDLSYSGIGINIHGIVEGIPTSTSGAVLLNFIDQARIDVKNYTGIDPGSPTVTERFVPAVQWGALAIAASSKALEGMDKSVRIGDFSTGGGSGDAAAAQGVLYEQLYNKALARLGRGGRYGRTY